MGIDSYGLQAGCAADVIPVPAETIAEAVVARPPGRTVVKRGRVVVRDGRLVCPV